MKDYMMWLDDRGIATWDNGIGELIVPEGVNIYDPATVDEYKNDEVWNGLDVPGIDTDEDDFLIDDDDEKRPIEWDDEDDEVSNIRLSEIQRDILMRLISSIVDPQPDQAAINGLDMGTDEMVHMWYLLQDMQNPEEIQHTAAEHMDDPDDGGRQLEFWMGSDGMTGEAENLLQHEYLNGELV
jgi:hypothetical protein